MLTTTGKTPVSGFSPAKARLDAAILAIARKVALEAGEDPEDVTLEPWRLHDARRTLATGLQRLGVRFEVTEAVLNHVSGTKSGIAGVYQRRLESREAGRAGGMGRSLRAATQSDTGGRQCRAATGQQFTGARRSMKRAGNVKPPASFTRNGAFPLLAFGTKDAASDYLRQASALAAALSTGQEGQEFDNLTLTIEAAVI